MIEEMIVPLNFPNTTYRSSFFRIALLSILVGHTYVGCSVTRPITPTANDAAPAPAPQYFSQNVVQKIDMLFVIDNSSGILQLQMSVAVQFVKLVESLGENNAGGSLYPIDLHVGIVSSDLGAGDYGLQSCEIEGGDGGRLQNEPRIASCTPPQDPWISYKDSQTNIPDSSGDPIKDLGDAFRCIAQLGIGGCGMELLFESARLALDPERGVNPGFLRPDAFLLVFFLTDEDDCSARDTTLYDPALTDTLGNLAFRCIRFSMQCNSDITIFGEKHDCRTEVPPPDDYLFPLQEYAEFFTGLKPPGRVFLTALAGPTDHIVVAQPEGYGHPVLEPGCEKTAGFARPALRIHHLLEHSLLRARGDLGLFNPAGVEPCDQDPGPAMAFLGRTARNLMQGRCFYYPVLTPGGGLACAAGDELGPGVTCAESCLSRVECQVEQITNLEQPDEQRASVAKCPAALFDPGTQDCGASCPCWRIVPRAECATGFGPAFGLEILRQGNQGAAPNTVAEARCPTSELKWGSPELLALGQCR